MAQPHAHSQPIETYGLAPHNRNIWPHNNRATVFCHAWPILLSVLVVAVYPLLTPHDTPVLNPHSFIHSGYFYSAPSRNLLRGALSPATVKEKCLKKLAERRHVVL